MSDLFSRLAARSLEQNNSLAPRLPTRFDPGYDLPEVAFEQQEQSAEQAPPQREEPRSPRAPVATYSADKTPSTKTTNHRTEQPPRPLIEEGRSPALIEEPTHQATQRTQDQPQRTAAPTPAAPQHAPDESKTQPNDQRREWTWGRAPRPRPQPRQAQPTPTALMRAKESPPASSQGSPNQGHEAAPSSIERAPWRTPPIAQREPLPRQTPRPSGLATGLAPQPLEQVKSQREPQGEPRIAQARTHGSTTQAPPVTGPHPEAPEAQVVSGRIGELTLEQNEATRAKPQPALRSTHREARLASPERVTKAQEGLTPAEPIIQVTIGKIEVWAEETPKARPAKEPPKTSLADYLRRRAGEER